MLKINKNKDFFTKRIHKSLDKLLLWEDIFWWEENIFLLDENRFKIFCWDFKQKFEEKFTIKDLKDIIKQKQEYVNINYGRVPDALFYNIEDISVDGKPQDYVIWNIWEIFFRLNMIFLNIDTLNLFKTLRWNISLQEQNIRIYPQTYFTLYFIKDVLKRKNTNILYIFNDFAKFIKLENGFYSNSLTIHLWIEKLKGIFKENDILPLYHDSFNISDLNDFSKKLVYESMDFYAELLNKWVADNSEKWEDLIVISDIIKNKYFLDIFGKNYNKYLNWYVLPFHNSKNLNKFNKSWSASQTDVLICLNNFIKK